MTLVQNVGLEVKASANNCKPSWIALLAVLAAFLLINLVTADRSPPVWQDEAMFADPAINFLSGKGWTSIAWPAQTSTDTFAANAPLYSMLLVPWLKIWGFSPTAVRSLNYVLMVLVILTLCSAARQFGLIRSRSSYWLLVALLIGGYGISFAYRCGRYDVTCLLIYSAMLNASAWQSKKYRRMTIALLAVSLPFAGLQTLPLLLIVSGLLCLIFGLRFLAEMISAIAGAATGCAIMVAWLKANHLFEVFAINVRGSSSIAQGLVPRLWSAVEGQVVDPSTLMGLLVLAVLAWAPLNARIRRVAMIGLLLGVAIPLAEAFIGKCPIYYSWMKFVPVSLCLACLIDDVAQYQPRIRKLVLLAMLLPALGFPLRLLVLVGEWQIRDYQTVTRFVNANVHPDDVVYCSFPAYYAAKFRAKQIFIPTHDLITPQELRELSVLLVNVRAVDGEVRRFGGAWHEVARLSSVDRQIQDRPNTLAPLYNLVLLRRDGSPNEKPAL